MVEHMGKTVKSKNVEQQNQQEKMVLSVLGSTGTITATATSTTGTSGSFFIVVQCNLPMSLSDTQMNVRSEALGTSVWLVPVYLCPEKRRSNEESKLHKSSCKQPGKENQSKSK